MSKIDPFSALVRDSLQGFAKILTDDKQPLAVAAVKAFEFQCWTFDLSIRAGKYHALLSLLEEFSDKNKNTYFDDDGKEFKYKMSDQDLCDLVKRCIEPPPLFGSDLTGLSNFAMNDQIEKAQLQAILARNIIDFSLRFAKYGDRSKFGGGSTMGRQIVNVTKYYQNETANYLGERLKHKKRKAKKRTQQIWNNYKDSAPMIYAVWETQFDLIELDSLGATLLSLAADRNGFKALFCRYNEIVRILSTVGYVYKTVEVEAVPFDPVILDPFPPDVLEAIDKYEPGEDNYWSL